MKLSNRARTDVNACDWVTTTVPLWYRFLEWMMYIFLEVSELRNVLLVVASRPIAICVAADVTLRVEECNFCASFGPALKCWTAAWKWSEGKEQRIEVEAY